jgi:hypothetical protein
MATPVSPLYPKFLHFEAMALRTVPNPPADALGTRGAAAAADRQAWSLCRKNNPADALLFAQSWGDWAWERDLFEEAGEAYANAHRAQTTLVLKEREREARLRMLSHTTFATRGAYAFYKTGEARQAVLLLEQTGLSAPNSATLRGELERLAKTAPELSARLLAATMSADEMHDRAGLDAFGRLSPQESQALAERDSIVAEIRRIAGFESFAKGAGWEEVAGASAQAPLVYLVPTGKGTVALAVAPGTQPARTIATVEIPAAVPDIQEAFHAFAQAEYGNGGDCRSALRALLEWLGSHVMVYVKSLLIKVSPEEGPFTLIPFGLLSSLPLHLGIIHPDQSRTQSLFHPRNVAFAYSAGGLVASQRRNQREPAGSRALVISNPHPIPPTFDELLLGDFEARMVASHFPSDMLAGRDADTQNVIQRLPTATVAHFNCHGTVDSRLGYTGVLLLANTEELGYEHLMTLPELAARLVVLSACRTGSAALAVEHCLSLPNAFLAAGSAAVLGTFWHTDELASLLLLGRFYELWLEPQTSRTPREALGEAQAWLMTASAQTFRAMLDPAVLESKAASDLKEARAEDRPYSDPWFWGGFFLAGA